MKNWLLNMLILSTSLFIVLLFAEIICRFVPPSVMTVVQISERKPTLIEYFSKDKKQTSVYEISPHGFRPNPGQYHIFNHVLSGGNNVLEFNPLMVRATSNSNNDFPVLIIGDSITAEDYLEVEDTWVFHLENLLNEKISLVNAGIPSLGIYGEIWRIKELLPKIKPKAIVLGWYLNDLTSCCAVLKVFRDTWYFRSAFIGKLNGLLWWVNGFYYFKEDISKVQLKALESSFKSSAEFLSINEITRNAILERFADWGNAWSPDSRALFRKAFDLLKEVANEAGVPLFVILFPHAEQLNAVSLNDYPQQYMASILDEMDIPYINLLDSFKNGNYNSNEVYIDHCHFKREMSPIIANMLLEPLKKKVLNKLY